MKLSAPKVTTWWIAVILGVLGILGKLVAIGIITTLNFWLVVVGLILLVLGTLIKRF
ncbi:MAG: hypothetical protein ONB30_05820 [candidate division KSB1 bacterium]|nr:hypothetical protein [candidate division KSB1 bacterium]